VISYSIFPPCALSARGNPERPPTAAAMPDPVDLLLQAFQDPALYRRLIGRLRPKLVGRPHPKRRLARLTGSLIRSPGRGSSKAT
jgi:hypothetical protein